MKTTNQFRLWLIICFFLIVACASSDIKNKKNPSTETLDSSLYLNGACKQVPLMHKFGEMIAGNAAHGSEGNFSCHSDIYREGGVRISPWISNGRAFFDFGPVKQDFISVTIQWVDNGWFNGNKAIEIYNWKKQKWEKLYKWDGNDKKEHFSTFNIVLNKEIIDVNQRIRVGIYSSGIAVVHLKTIKVL